MTGSLHALVASGGGRYADPWHPFGPTSSLLTEVLESAGFAVSVSDDVDDALSSLDEVDLFVVNAGDPWRSSPPSGEVSARARDGLAAALDRGVGILAMHCAVASLRDYPAWPVAVGAVWVPGLSFHPPIGETGISGGALPDGSAVAGFEVFDERYSRLQWLAGVDVVASHEIDDRREPTAWVRATGAVPDRGRPPGPRRTIV